MGRPKKTTEQWIAEAKACHDDRYDYSETIYTGSNKKLAIRCKKHGLFYVTAGDFLKGNNCPQCATEARRVDMADYVERANKVHGGKYTNYRVGKNPRYIIATCPEHGDFEQDKFAHLNGNGCPKCALVKRSNRSKSQEELNRYFIERARKVHGDFYDYTKSVYVNNTTSLTVTCPKHGDFTILPTYHINGGHGCQECAHDKMRERFIFTQEQFEEQARRIHGDKYKYGAYNGMRKKIEIECPVHGKFLQSAGLHVRGEGCPLCGREQAAKTMSYTQEEYIRKVRKVHHKKYDYSITKYSGMKNDISYICHMKDKNGNEHGVITQKASSHLMGFGCSKCNSSHLELDMMHFLESKGVEFIHQKRAPWLNRQTLDFFLPKYNVAIECQVEQHYKPVKHFGGEDEYRYIKKNDIKKLGKCTTNGIFLYYYTNIPNVSNNVRTFDNVDKMFEAIDMIRTLSEEIGGKVLTPNTFLLNGTTVMLARGVTEKRTTLSDMRNEYNSDGRRLIIVFDYEFATKGELVKNKLLHIAGLHKDLTPIYGRRCTVEIATTEEASNFHNKFHIQGAANGTVHLSAKFDGNVVAIMSFKRNTNGGSEWELTRFSTNTSYKCPGVAGKLFSFFVKNYEPSEIKSFADRRWTMSNENLYTNLGFYLDAILEPDYMYIGEDGIPHHKFGFRKQRLSKHFNLPMEMTEREMTEKLGYSRVWNAGLLRYVWRSKRIDTNST